MPVDPNFLRQHYASLSDDAFDAIDPEDLVEDARRVYDEERKQRKRPSVAAKVQEREEEIEESEHAAGDDSEPDWLEEAAVATTFYSYGANDAAGDAEDARAALEEAGIPCHIAAQKPEPRRQEPELEYRLLVPARFNLEAGSVLEQRVFTEDYAEAWKSHFSELSDEELREVNLDAIFGGLRERIEQITEAYQEELASREGSVKQRR